MTAPITADSFVYGLVSAGSPRIAPDASRIVYVRGWSDRATAAAASELWTCAIDGSAQARLVTTGDRPRDPRWSPDGRQLAYVATVDGATALLVMPAAGGESRVVVSHARPIQEIAWSPDGASIAYVTEIDATPAVAPGPNTPPVRVVRRIDYKQDNRGYLNDLRPQLHVVYVASGATRQLTSEPFDHNVPQWSPDGRTIAIKQTRLNGMASSLLLVDVATGVARAVTPERGVVTQWAWSPAGDRLLVAGDESMTWQTDLYEIEAATGARRRLTDDLACLPDAGFPTVTPASQPVWLDERTAIFHAVRAGSSGIYTVDTESGAVSQAQGWQAMNAGMSADAAARCIVQAFSSLSRTGEIVVFDRETGRAEVITDLNGAQLAATPPAAWERFDIERNGLTIEAWLLTPHGYDPAKRYPLVLDIHGGPNSFYGYTLNGNQQSLAGAGFMVLYCNPRGSGSYGREFTQQVTGDWGGEDYFDLMAVVDAACARPDVDPARTGVYGYSYGGFMVAWIIGHTERFKAAVCGAPVVDLRSFYGTSDIGHIFGPLQSGGDWFEQQEYYESHSPIVYLDRATTPTLIVHGEADDRCPIGQGEQMFATLLAAGCETEFVRYPGGAHPFLRSGYPAHRADYYQRVTDWFLAHL
jgi:dipeptidyl aminopeptidase/acylaminoacyl peptidase